MRWFSDGAELVHTLQSECFFYCSVNELMARSSIEAFAIKVAFSHKSWSIHKAKTNWNSHMAPWVPAVVEPLKNSLCLCWFHAGYNSFQARANPCCRRPERGHFLLQSIVRRKLCSLYAWVKYNLYLFPQEEQLMNPCSGAPVAVLGPSLPLPFK